jgi:hypothetical protein
LIKQNFKAIHIPSQHQQLPTNALIPHTRTDPREKTYQKKYTVIPITPLITTEPTAYKFTIATIATAAPAAPNIAEPVAIAKEEEDEDAGCLA